MEPDVLPDALRTAGVTPRELEIFWLVADRLQNREIAEQLHVSERTVESHVSALLRKLGGSNRMSLVEAGVRFRSSGSAPGSSIPVPLSSFVGRTEQVEDLVRLVAEHRLVTLTGPAGAGKTRLALRLARSVETLPAAVLVDLAPIPGPRAVERAFAEALGIDGDGHQLRAALRQTLASGGHWLVVDNCEHVTEAVAGLLADLLSAARRLNVLATSHGPLRVVGEVVYPVPPLEVPPEADDPEAVLRTAAARLFADRAAASSPGFRVDAGNARDVATVCRRLDGLPLAIELAATRVRSFSPAELVARLDDRFALLTDGAHGPASRHRTLEEALRWSYDLLDDGERLLLERCSVFPADFDYDTAAGVLAYPPLGSSDLARLFPRLLDRSLIAARRRGQTTEYRLLDSIRQFADGRLRSREGAEPVRAAHAGYHLRHGVALLPDLRGGAQVGALAWFNRRWADLSAAMGWAIESGRIDLAWDFVAGIGTGWESLGVRGELFDWLEVLLELPLPDGSLGVRAAVTTAVLLCYQDLERARAFAERACAEAPRGSEEEALARLALGLALKYGADRPAAGRHLTAAVAEFQRRGDRWHEALARFGVGYAEPDLEARLAHMGRSADLFGELHDHVKRANALNGMAIHAVENGIRLADVEDWLAEARRLALHTGNRHEWLHAEGALAHLQQSRGDHQAAEIRFAELLPEFRRIGDRRCTSRCLVGLGRAALHDGDLARAREIATEAISVTASIAESARMAAGLRLLAEIESGLGAGGSGGAGGGGDDEEDGEPLGGGEDLAEDEEADDSGDGGFEAHQDAEDLGRDSAEGFEFQGVRDD